MTTKRTLAEWRKRKGLSQAELGKKVGVSRPTIARYEAEGFSTANYVTVMMMLKALDVKLDQIEIY